MKKIAFAVVVAFLIVGGSATAVALDDPKELESNCDAGNLDACVKLGHMFTNSANYDNIQQDYAGAMSLYEKACAGNSPEGCYRVGEIYEKGRGVPKDYTLANSHFEQACSLASLLGCLRMIKLHHPQTGAIKDATRWAVFMEKTCDLFTEMGQYCLELGLAFDLGMWVPKDSDHANELFKKGCFHGSKEACNLIKR